MSWEQRLLLIAEDSDDDYFLFDRSLKKANFKNPVCRIKNGQEVIHYLSGVAPYSDRTAYPFPYVLLLDLKLPIKHGFDVLEWIGQQEKLKVLPVIVFSSSQQADDVRKAYELGANGFVSKSTTMEDLIEVVTAIKAYWLKINSGPSIEGTRGG